MIWGLAAGESHHRWPWSYGMGQVTLELWFGMHAAIRECFLQVEQDRVELQEIEGPWAL